MNFAARKILGFIRRPTDLAGDVIREGPPGRRSLATRGRKIKASAAVSRLPVVIGRHDDDAVTKLGARVEMAAI